MNIAKKSSIALCPVKKWRNKKKTQKNQYFWYFPKVVESGQLFAASLSGYLYNLREMAEKLYTYLHLDADFLNRIQIPELTTYLKSAL